MIKLIAKNKKAFYNYFVLEKIETGIELFGTEVKSVRVGKINIKDAWCSFKNEEIFVNNIHISHYEKGNIFNCDPVRTRKLLVHKREILKLQGQSKQKGLSVVVLSIYIKNKWIKLEIALCKGKKLYDKRMVKAKKDSDMKIQRALKEMISK
ncbi:MAG: SsrA-binding protein SmpB [Firmicutes bacterium]|nr:SsrA-binding protein SmpB [Bacillota bacterium]